MKPVSCAVFSRELAQSLGKGHAESDLELYHRAHGEALLSFIYPKSFPEKVNALLQALYLADAVLLEVEKLDSSAGEIILAADALKKGLGFVVLGSAIDEGLFAKVIAGTVVERYARIEKSEILDKLAGLEAQRGEGGTEVDLDSVFEVKGVGTVGLGFVRQGSLKKYQNLVLFPPQTAAMVKSIQMQDKDAERAEPGDRVGLALKGVESKEFSRGWILGEENAFQVGQKASIRFQKSKFYKKELQANQQLHLQCRLQVTGCKVLTVGTEVVVETSKPIAGRKGDLVSLADVSQSPRIVGGGSIEGIQG